VAIALAANNPRLFSTYRRTIEGAPTSLLYPILEEAPRYLAWLAAQGFLGAVHPWIAVVAGDLGRRIRWRWLAPERGSGRLLWICEEMATRLHTDQAVPELFQAARRRDITAPDWPVGRPPRQCRLDKAGYRHRCHVRQPCRPPRPRHHHLPTRGDLTLWTGQSYQAAVRLQQHQTTVEPTSTATAASC
jgi:helicase